MCQQFHVIPVQLRIDPRFALYNYDLFSADIQYR